MVLSNPHNKKLHQTNIAAFVLCKSLRSILHKPLSAIFAGELGVRGPATGEIKGKRYHRRF